MNDKALKKLRVLLDVNDFIKLATIPCRKSEYARCATPIVEPETLKWNFRILSIMLNELNGWKPDPKNGCKIHDISRFRFKELISSNIGLILSFNFKTKVWKIRYKT